MAGFLLIAHGISAAPTFNVPGSESLLIESEEGKAVLQWSPASDAADSDAEFILQQSKDPAFSKPRKLYEGPDRGTVVTGLPEGEYFFRVREALGTTATPEDWSETLTVRVEYPARHTVVLLMSLGMIVFVGTVAAILIGYRQTSSERAVS